MKTDTFKLCKCKEKTSWNGDVGQRSLQSFGEEIGKARVIHFLCLKEKEADKIKYETNQTMGVFWFVLTSGVGSIFYSNSNWLKARQWQNKRYYNPSASMARELRVEDV